MRYRTLGPFSVSSVGLGCMNMSMGYGVADKHESLRLLDECIDLGCNFLDTASMYGMGRNEELIGNALKYRRNEFVLASKCGFVKDDKGALVKDGRPQTIKQTCEDSLRRLQTDVIDLYYLHRLDPKVPVEESVGALSELVDEGKIKTIGLSEVCAETARRAHGVHPVTAIQSEYSLWSRTPERKILSVCDDLDIGFVAFSPLGRSFFTGVSSDVTQLGKNDIRTGIARPRFEPENFARNLKLLVPFDQIAREQACSMAQLALAWILARGDNIVPIPGTKDISHMRENVAAADVELDHGVVEKLNRLINESTVVGRRYTDALMDSTDSERD